MATLRALTRASGLVRAAPAVTRAVPTVRQLSQTPRPQNLLTEKTGQTGVAVLGAGLAAYLISKEIIVLHAETVVVASVAGVTYMLMKKAGPGIAAALDERAKAIADSLSVGKIKRIQKLEDDIKEQENIKSELQCTGEIYDINRELNNMQRELEYRVNKQAARDAAIKQLDEMVRISSEQRAAEQAELVAKLEKEVIEALKGQESALLSKCVQDLKKLSASA